MEKEKKISREWKRGREKTKYVARLVDDVEEEEKEEEERISEKHKIATITLRP